jgi:chromosome segregation ATPase
MEVLAHAVKMSGDKRLAKLAKNLDDPPESMATGSHFDEVIAAIDEMIKTLKSEEETDLENKETCEKDRADDTRTAIKAARTMDERSDTIDELKNDIVEIIKTIEENTAEIKAINEEIEKAEKLRAGEHAEWEASNHDDEAANQLVLQAKDVLSRFYEENNLVFIQKKKMEPVVAGEAPPPPPKTWEEPYGGKTGESNGIVAILEMISEDLLKDKAKAKAEEDKAQATFEAFKENSEKQIQTLEDANAQLTDTKGAKEDDIATAKEQRLAKKDELETVIAKINDATPSCVYNTINYPVRLKNRQIEIDGLEKAKAILEGGEFPSMLQRK